MELNGKIVLLESSDYERLSDILVPCFSHKKSYRDFFFDFISSTLERHNIVLRLRVLCKYLRESPEGEAFTGDPGEPCSASLVLKENNKVECGEQMLFVQEENSLPWSIVDEVLNRSSNLFKVLQEYSATATGGVSSQSPCQRIVSRLEALGLASNEPQPLELHQVGSYATKRAVYTYRQGFLTRSVSPQDSTSDGVVVTEDNQSSKMHICVDKTLFPFGEKYELEVHNINIPLCDVLEEIQEFLKHNNIRHSLGSESKFLRFMKYVHGLNAVSEYVQEVKLRIAGVNGYKEVLGWLDTAQDATIRSQSVHNDNNNNNFNDVLSISQVSQSTPPRGHLSGKEDLGIEMPHHVAYTQTQPQSGACDCSQRVTHQPELEYSGRKSLGRHEDSDCEEQYQEDYYFDTLHSTLLERHCFVRLRCLNNGESFLFSIKENSKVENSEQECVTCRVELSGDVARVLMLDPTQFLTEQREHNAVAAVLWSRIGVRSLRVVAFFRTERRVYDRRLRAAVSPQRSPAPPEAPEAPLWGSPSQGGPPALSGAPGEAGGQALRIHVDRTVYDLSRPAEVFAAIAARSPSGSYSRAEGQAPATHVTELYEIELTNLVNVSTQVARRWITGELDALGIEWRRGIQRKVEQYFYLADMLLTQRVGGSNNQEASVDVHFSNELSREASLW